MIGENDTGKKYYYHTEYNNFWISIITIIRKKQWSKQIILSSLNSPSVEHHLTRVLSCISLKGWWWVYHLDLGGRWCYNRHIKEKFVQNEKKKKNKMNEKTNLENVVTENIVEWECNIFRKNLNSHLMICTSKAFVEAALKSAAK